MVSREKENREFNAVTIWGSSTVQPSKEPWSSVLDVSIFVLVSQFWFNLNLHFILHHGTVRRIFTGFRVTGPTRTNQSVSRTTTTSSYAPSNWATGPVQRSGNWNIGQAQTLCSPTPTSLTTWRPEGLQTRQQWNIQVSHRISLSCLSPHYSNIPSSDVVFDLIYRYITNTSVYLWTK